MSATCPAIKYTCRYFNSTLKNRCALRKPYVRKNGRYFFCKSHSSSKEIKDMGMFSLITEGSRAI